ncbi:MAG: thiolase family protein [Spirochaetes bacterium]|nr:thiolase family protein [Spirochaetota bacterium]
MEKTAIIGVGQTKQERNKKHQNFAEMVYEATQLALGDAGLDIKDIDNVITVSNDFWDGRTISSMAVQDVAGAYEKNVSTVEGDGTFGAYYAMTRILSGSYKNTLVVAHSKGSESDTNLITNGMFEPIFTRPLGLDNITSAAMQARSYMNAFGATEADFAAVSVKNHGNALGNPHAQIAKKISVDDVLQSKKLADPLKLYDISPITDGAAAMIIAGDEFTRKLAGGKVKPVYLKGAAFCSDAYDLGLRDLARSPALKAAAEKAYQMAGIKDPAKDIDLAEIYDAFSYMELMWYEGLGFCGEGKGAEFMKSGATQMTGALPVNASGGVLSAHAVVTAGLIRMIEAALQIRGDAGAHQVQKKVKTALAHGINGPCAQAHCVWVLGASA